jgi:hypothetical protein
LDKLYNGRQESTHEKIKPNESTRIVPARGDARTMKRQPDLVLVTGPMVGASSWAPTAERLRASGWRVQVPDVISVHGALPPWHALSAHYAKLLSPARPPILVGHSLATVVVADLATQMATSGLIMVDGEIPPACGPVLPGREAFRTFVLGLADDDGALPPWSDWWRDHPRRSYSGLDELARDADAFALFWKDQPHVCSSWFDDTIDLAPWAHIPAGYIQTSGFYDHTADDAEARGWPLRRLQGTHLHPTLQPEETARAIAAIAHELVGGS